MYTKFCFCCINVSNHFALIGPTAFLSQIVSSNLSKSNTNSKGNIDISTPTQSMPSKPKFKYRKEGDTKLKGFFWNTIPDVSLMFRVLQFVFDI